MSHETGQQPPETRLRSGFSTFVWHLTALAVFTATVLVIVGYAENTGWSGLVDYTMTMDVGDNEELVFERSKTLWDWLSLLVVPLGLGLVAYWFSQRSRENEQEIARQNRETDFIIAEANRVEDKEIAQEQQEQRILNTYYDRMSDLLLNCDLSKSGTDKHTLAKKIARTRTLDTLQSINGRRKGLLVRFLYEGGLINKPPLVVMKGADLVGADLASEDLQNADLSRSNLVDAVLNEAKLQGINLKEADLTEAILTDATLRSADLSKTDFTRAIMDGTNLEESNLSGAVFDSVDLSTVRIRNVIYNVQTKWPDGYTPPEPESNKDIDK